MTNLQTPEELQNTISQGERLFSQEMIIIRALEQEIKEYESKIAELNRTLTTVKTNTKHTEQMLNLLGKVILLGD
jgi:hypothetical protein